VNRGSAVSGSSRRVAAASKPVGPALPPVHDPEDFDCFGTYSIRHDIRRSADHQLARPCPPAGPAEFREVQQAGDGRKNTFNLPVSGGPVVTSDIRPRRPQIVNGWLRPDYPHLGMGSSLGCPHD
jgi:hypothetical protein